MKSRSKRTTSKTGGTEGMERSRRLRQTTPIKSPRQTKKRTPQSTDSIPAGTQKLIAVPLEVVRFELIAPSAREVFLAGTFNNWKCGATPMTSAGSGKWIAELTLHHGVHEYRFVVDGEWKLDPANMESVPNPFGEANSVLIIGPFSSPGRKSGPSE